MKQILFATTRSSAPLFLRLLLGIVLFPHGAQKLLGWFGGFAFEGSMGYFTGTVGLPWIVGFLVILVEFFGPLFLILGFATRFWSLAIFFVMSGIVVTSMHDYFFMNWFGNQKSEGMEFFLLTIGMSLSLLVSGSGRWAVDRLLQRRADAARLGGARFPVPEFSAQELRA
ncbi:DoxX family protein [Flaviaesturariibacter amylovorans]|uniref:DoxX family protein n=1 Tax=Flaviaesturariibacter amylovorans TaxID=1084520 RepID=A0ABP8GCN8_9BACT